MPFLTFWQLASLAFKRLTWLTCPYNQVCHPPSWREKCTLRCCISTSPRHPPAPPIMIRVRQAKARRQLCTILGVFVCSRFSSVLMVQLMLDKPARLRFCILNVVFVKLNQYKLQLSRRQCSLIDIQNQLHECVKPVMSQYIYERHTRDTDVLETDLAMYNGNYIHKSLARP